MIVKLMADHCENGKVSWWYYTTPRRVTVSPLLEKETIKDLQGFDLYISDRNFSLFGEVDKAKVEYNDGAIKKNPSRVKITLLDDNLEEVSILTEMNAYLLNDQGQTIEVLNRRTSFKSN